MKKEISGYWMFICNPNKWEIDRFMRSGVLEDTYSISEYHKDYFKKGQMGIVRVGRDSRPKKKLGDNPKLLPGIYAVVKVLSEPEMLVSDKGNYWIDQEAKMTPRLRVRLKYLSTHLDDPVLITDLNGTQIVENDPLIIKGVQASSFPILKTSFDFIVALLQDSQANNNATSFEPIEEQEYSEGKTYYKQHITRERDPKLMREAKSRFIREHGSLYCEVCGFNFKDHYGERGNDFIEGHHTKYVSELSREEKTKPSDIVMLCPNCHRMIHRSPRVSVEELKVLFK